MTKVISKSCTARKHEPSAKQQDNAQKIAAASDSSPWRASKIGSSVTITKTKALAQYHLKAADLEGVPFQTKQIVIKGNFVRPMYLYKKRDIERRAWEKRGQSLVEPRAQHLEKKASADFLQPRAYDDPRGEVSIVGLAPGTPARCISAFT
ncbi:hypothetical protein V8D89_005419 [Ganoderma adspersum]